MALVWPKVTKTQYNCTNGPIGCYTIQYIQVNLFQKHLTNLTNPQYDKRLFIELRIQYLKTTSLEHVVYINCSECQYKNKKNQFVYTTCSKLVVFMCWTCKSMNTLLSCSGLVAARISAFRFDTRTKNIVCKKKIKKHSVTRIRPFLSAQSK